MCNSIFFETAPAIIANAQTILIPFPKNEPPSVNAQPKADTTITTKEIAFAIGPEIDC